MDSQEELVMAEILGALGYASSLFMTQECKGTEIVMPTEELEDIAKKLYNNLHDEGHLR